MRSSRIPRANWPVRYMADTTPCYEKKLIERWALILLALVGTFIVGMLVEDKMAVFTAFMSLTSMGFGWYFRDKQKPV